VHLREVCRGVCYTDDIDAPTNAPTPKDATARVPTHCLTIPPRRVAWGMPRSRFRRNRRVLRAGVLFAVLPATGACGADAPPPARVTAAANGAVIRPPTPSDSLCPRDGSWRSCHLEDRINKAGMGITVLDTITVPYFTEQGTRYKIGKTAKLVAFFFADSAAGAAATASLDALRLTPPRDSIGKWPTAPFEAIRTANMIAVLFEVTAGQAERVRLALTAGAPQSYADKAQSLPPATAR
jgi:hypothetical protein